jgi:hypothetical protein
MSHEKSTSIAPRASDLPDLSMLIAYLQYALDDLQRVDKVSALLVDAAINKLQNRKKENQRH